MLLICDTGDEARAGERFGFPIRVGAFAGWHATADDYDVLGVRRAAFVPGAGPMFGLRLGWQFSEAFALELDAGVVAAPVAADRAWLLPTRLMLQWRPLAGTVTPTVGLGAGFVASVSGPGSGDLDALLGGTLGFEVRLGSSAALRLEGGLLASDGAPSGLSWTPFATLGIDLLAWRERRASEPVAAPPPLRPKLPPAGCPAGTAVELCRDSDGDRRIDAFDLCPSEVGERSDGCPDPDADGSVGPRDACPRDRGAPEDWGCPR